MYNSRNAINGMNTDIPIVTSTLMTRSESFPLWAAAYKPTLIPIRMTISMTAAKSSSVQGSFSAIYWETGIRLAKLLPRLP